MIFGKVHHGLLAIVVVEAVWRPERLPLLILAMFLTKVFTLSNLHVGLKYLESISTYFSQSMLGRPRISSRKSVWKRVYKL